MEPAGNVVPWEERRSRDHQGQVAGRVEEAEAGAWQRVDTLGLAGWYVLEAGSVEVRYNR